MMPATDVVIVHEKQEPVLLTLIAKPGTGFAGKTTILNGFHVVDGSIQIRCQPRERAGLVKYFGRCYQMVEPQELPKNGPGETDAATVDHEDPEVPGGVQPEQPRPAKKPVARKSRPFDTEAGVEELRS